MVQLLIRQATSRVLSQINGVTHGDAVNMTHGNAVNVTRGNAVNVTQGNNVNLSYHDIFLQ
jgi:hypothetical protein